MPVKIPATWSHAELQALIPLMNAQLKQMEAAEDFEVKPLGPMTQDEARELINRILATAETRQLTRQECFLHGQLLAQFAAACIAEVLTGKKGRFLVVSEDDINRQLARARKVN